MHMEKIYFTSQYFSLMSGFIATFLYLYYSLDIITILVIF